MQHYHKKDRKEKRMHEKKVFLPNLACTTRDELLLKLQGMTGSQIDKLAFLDMIAYDRGIRNCHDQINTDHYDYSPIPTAGVATATAATVATAAASPLDSATVDSATVDSATVDSATVDSATVDSATVDSATVATATVATVATVDSPVDVKTTELLPLVTQKVSKNKLKKQRRTSYKKLEMPSISQHKENSTINVSSRVAELSSCVMLSNNRQNTNNQNNINQTPLYHECNGLVIDTNTWRALSVPPNAFNHKINSATVNSYLNRGLYDVKLIDDGTIVTLYHRNHSEEGFVWSLSSSNGYDVSAFLWVGNLTYASIIYDLIHRLYPEFEAASGLTINDQKNRLNFTSLDTSRCYTIGFRHHLFHPMLSDPERIWQIQNTDTSGALPVTTYDIKYGLHGIPIQREGPKFRTLALYREYGKSSLKDASNKNIGLNYGVILRSNDRKITQEFSDLIIESSLLTWVRRNIYEGVSSKTRPYLTPYNRIEFYVMRAFLTLNERNTFLSLFPNWITKFNKYEEFVSNVISLVTHMIRQNEMAPNRPTSKIRSITAEVAKRLYTHITSIENFTGFHPNVDSILKDYIVNPEYAYLFLCAITHEKMI